MCKTSLQPPRAARAARARRPGPLLWAGLTFAVASAWALAPGRQREREPEPEREQPAAQPSSDTSSVDLLRSMEQRLAQQEARIRQLANTASQVDETVAAEAQQQIPSETVPEPEPLEPAELANLFDGTLEHQVVDDVWAAEVSQQVHALADDLADRLAIEEVDCGSTLCRASIAHMDVAARRADLNDLTLQAPFNTHGFVHVPDEAAAETLVYFSRDGFDLPDLH